MKSVAFSCNLLVFVAWQVLGKRSPKLYVQLSRETELLAVSLRILKKMFKKCIKPPIDCNNDHR